MEHKKIKKGDASKGSGIQLTNSFEDEHEGGSSEWQSESSARGNESQVSFEQNSVFKQGGERV